jgi:hypothetical protein
VLLRFPYLEAQLFFMRTFKRITIARCWSADYCFCQAIAPTATEVVTLPIDMPSPYPGWRMVRETINSTVNRIVDQPLLHLIGAQLTGLAIATTTIQPVEVYSWFGRVARSHLTTPAPVKTVPTDDEVLWLPPVWMDELAEITEP